jgi:hypothetical protein
LLAKERSSRKEREPKLVGNEPEKELSLKVRDVRDLSSPMEEEMMPEKELEEREIDNSLESEVS